MRQGRPRQQREPGEVERQITGMGRRERAAHKARVLAEVGRVEPWQVHGVWIEIIDGPKMRGEMLDVSVSVRDATGRKIAVDNPLLFINPPIIHEGREDLPEALRAIVGEAVRVIMARAGQPR